MQAGGERVFRKVRTIPFERVPLRRQTITLDAVKRLYLLRHAKSSWDEPDLADHERPLAARGRKACAKLATYLRTEAVEPEIVLCSSSRRTRETLELILPALGQPQVEIEDELYAAPAEHLLDRLRALPGPAGSALLIAHNPGMQDLALRIAPGDARLARKFPTGALASFTLEGPWSQLGESAARLLAFVSPRELP
jgi:phosphohistidine phosphatase